MSLSKQIFGRRTRFSAAASGRAAGVGNTRNHSGSDSGGAFDSRYWGAPTVSGNPPRSTSCFAVAQSTTSTWALQGIPAPASVFQQCSTTFPAPSAAVAAHTRSKTSQFWRTIRTAHPRLCSQSLPMQLRHFQSSSAAFEKQEPSKTTPKDAGPLGTEDTVPDWQNPLHHNNPEMTKMFEEDFEEGEDIVPSPLPPFETDPEKVVAPPHVHDLAHRIVNLSLLELKELTEKIAEHFDFDDEVMAASYSRGSTGQMATTALSEDQQEEKVIFDLKLIGFDAKAKIKVIKEIRAIAGLGLKEAKELVESAPKVFQKDLKQDKADELKAQLEAVGAQVEIV